jgi:FMN-dependent NADH-azoreductase
MSQSLLVLKSSPGGDVSVSDLLVDEIVAQYRAFAPRTSVVEHHLDRQPLPHLNSAIVNGVRAEAKTDLEVAARRVSDQLIEELKAADVLVIGSPMHNFSIPPALRGWFDHVLRPRETFTYTGTGPRGLVTGKTAFLVLARGGVYSEGPAKPLDFQEPYLRQLLGFIGITDIEIVLAEGIGYGPEARDAAIAAARTKIAGLIGQRKAA